MKMIQIKKEIFAIGLSVLLIVILLTGCKKDDTTPDSGFPAMTSISITGQTTTFDVVVGFSQGAYRFADQTGDLTEQSFKISSSGGVANILSYVVTQSAGQKSATIRIVFDHETNGKEIISVQPFNGNSIFNNAGQPMNANNIKSISTSGIEHEVITVSDSGNGTGTTTWTSNNIYLLDGFVFVNSGQTLTIEAGTVIKGKAGQGNNASALIVSKGSKILAEGTAEDPIIFTSEGDDLNGSVGDLDSGLWGGVIVLGNAVLNTIPAEQQIEGIPTNEPRGSYGGNNDEDNSGVLRYISIRHGGTDIGEGNEINGLTLGGVGNKTVIEFIEVFANRDDGVEIFGGAPRLKNIISVFCGDDLFDYDQGFHGNGQFWVGVQGFGHGDRVGEHDGGTEPETGKPYATPQIFNATYVGLQEGAGKRVITFRDNAGGHYANSIFYQQAFGVDIELLTTECSFSQFQDDNLTLKNNIFYMINEENLLDATAGEGVAQEETNDANSQLNTYFSSAMNEIYNPGFNLNGLTFDVIPANNVSENLASYPVDSWFETVNYKGAFDPNGNWAEGWTLFSKYMN